MDEFYNDGFHTGEKIAENTYRIDEGEFVNCYLLIGEEKALLIDSGVGLGNVLKFAENYTDKPIIMAITHNHCDHALGRGWFKDYYFPEHDNGFILKVLSSKFAGKQLIKGHDVKICKKPNHPKKILLKDGDVLDLGGRKIICREMPGHTKGSMIYLDDKEKIMITGDDVNPILWMQLPGNVCLSKWMVGAERILELSKTYTPFYGHGDGRQSTESISAIIDVVSKLLKEDKTKLSKKAFFYPNKDAKISIFVNPKIIK